MSIHEIVANHDEGMFASGPSFLLKFSEFLFVLSNFLIFFFFKSISVSSCLKNQKTTPNYICVCLSRLNLLCPSPL